MSALFLGRVPVRQRGSPCRFRVPAVNTLVHLPRVRLAPLLCQTPDNPPSPPFTHTGVCGKTPETAYLQDLLTYSIKGLACWTDFAAKQGVEVPAEVYSFLHAATFATLTNVNFDDARFKVGKREGRSEWHACDRAARVARSAALHAAPSPVSPCMHTLTLPCPPHPTPAGVREPVPRAAGGH